MEADAFHVPPLRVTSSRAAGLNHRLCFWDVEVGQLLLGERLVEINDLQPKDLLKRSFHC